ncbi:MAG: isochorismatase family protein, partial [Chloroflexi bacterium]|nr:isochorismatase family protein [Chloroflexota bacterium]
MTKKGKARVPAVAGEAMALLIIDVQRGLFRRPTPIYREEALLQNLEELVERAQAAGAPVVYIQHTNERLLPEGSDEWLLHPALQPRETDLRICKRHGSAFAETPLGEELAQRGVGGLVITGLVT